MEYVCMKAQLVDAARLLHPIPVGTKRPRQFPSLPSGHQLVCGVDDGNGERIIICPSFESMLALHREYEKGHVAHITWYHTDAFLPKAA